MTIKSPGPSGAFVFSANGTTVSGARASAMKSEYWQTGEWCRQRQRSDVAMNTEMRTLDDDPGYAEAKRRRQKT